MKVHIADNHDLVIEGFRHLLDVNGIDVVGSSIDGLELIKWTNSNQVDVIILDISMPNKNGIEVLEHYKKHQLSFKILIVSSYLQFDLISMAMNLGAKGFILKSEAATCIIEGLHTVYQGNYFYSQKIQELLVNEKLFPANSSQEKMASLLLTKTLSDQELNVLKMLVNDYSSDEIENELSISKSTIRTYTSRIREKLNIKTNIGLVVRYSFLKK